MKIIGLKFDKDNINNFNTEEVEDGFDSGVEKIYICRADDELACNYIKEILSDKYYRNDIDVLVDNNFALHIPLKEKRYSINYSINDTCRIVEYTLYTIIPESIFIFLNMGCEKCLAFVPDVGVNTISVFDYIL